jgi:hypothetical protein
MSKHRFHVDKETSYYPDGKKVDIFSVDCDGDFAISAISRDEMLELVEVLNFAINDSIEKKEITHEHRN